MLDIQFIRENAELVKEKSSQKQVNVDIDRLLELDKKRRELLSQIEEKRTERNQLIAGVFGKPSEEAISRGTVLKNELAVIEKDIEPVTKEYTDILKKVPNVPTDDVPVGKTEAENQVVKEWGTKKDYDFEPKPHWVIGEEGDLIDKERAAKISGSRFTYLKGGLVELEFAIISFITQKLTDESLIEELIKTNNLKLKAKSFVPIIPPMMMRTGPYEATGRLKAEEITYKLADDDLWLIASAEHSLCSMYMDEVLDEAQLPIRYLGFSTSFRREAGTYGKDTNGIVRMHHFNKLEMEVFSTPETSLDEHYLLIAIQEYIIQQLELPYRLLLKCTADIGSPNARGVDIDAWMPGENAYKEITTADYMTDYQARDLKTRVRRSDGKVELLHTNDATAMALDRTLAVIMDNYQTKTGKIAIPKVLKPYMQNREEI
jgi:seryl-tRNA synthetase